jgi:hypothetical protein
MPGLAKEVPAPEVQQTPTPKFDQSGTMTWEDVPIDIFRHFNLDLGTVEPKSIDKLRTIYAWARDCEDPTVGNVLQRIASLENKLGSPRMGNDRYDKMWRWIKLQNQINDLQKRQSSMRQGWL